jgi:Uma2 family endonuclease
LGLLINRKKQELEMYRPDREIEVLQAPQTISVADVLSGLTLNLQQIWA